MNKHQPTMPEIVSLAKQRGFIFPASEIYGGLGGTYTYGPLGVELKNNIKQLWWEMFVQRRQNIYGIDGPILLHPKLWEASGHASGFNDAMVDCKKCKRRFRADHVVEDATGKDLEGQLDEMSKILKDEKIPCPECGESDWTDARTFNMMFTTTMANIVDDEGSDVPVYLRPETAGAIFVEFKNVVDSMRPKIPFGIAQIGKAFRNEIVASNFIFRLREFEQMEIEYFIHPNEKWEPLFEDWLKQQEAFLAKLGVAPDKLRRLEHPKEKLSHYSQKTVDIEYEFPFGFKELYGLAHRGSFDLSQHAKHSGQKLEYMDQTTGERFVPHVLEPTFGVDRTVLVTLLSAYTKENVDGEDRVVLRFPPRIAPVKAAVFPLMRNKPELVEKARTVFETLSAEMSQIVWDDNGNVGKRYRRQDEIGTPCCITIDFDTIKDDTVTVRDRDTMEQERIAISDLVEHIQKKIS